MGRSDALPLPATREDPNQQLPSPKRYIYGIDISGDNDSRILDSYEDDELLDSSRLESVVVNILTRAKWIGRHLNDDNMSDFDNVLDCCVGFPLYFTCKQRRLGIAQDIHDTTAAALMCRFYSADLLLGGMVLNIVFIDMSKWGDMQVSIVELKKDQLEILSHAHDRSFPGYAFDDIVLKYFSGIPVKDAHSVQVVGKGSKIPAVMKEFIVDSFSKEFNGDYSRA